MALAYQGPWSISWAPSELEQYIANKLSILNLDRGRTLLVSFFQTFESFGNIFKAF